MQVYVWRKRPAHPVEPEAVYRFTEVWTCQRGRSSGGPSCLTDFEIDREHGTGATM